MELVLRVLRAVAVTFGISFVIIMLKASGERSAIDAAASSLDLYTNDSRVCAGKPVPTDANRVFATFPSEAAARDGEERREIAHCGACGHCSNMHDMNILARTTHTLTDDATWCSKKGYVMSLFLWRGIDVYRRVSEECMVKDVGFSTPKCLDCWLDDMVCSIQACVFTCLKSQYILREPKNGGGGDLNTCLECDEKICGPDFLRCSGANRRRQGIQSDIGRDDDKELCRSVDVDWNAIAKTAPSSHSLTGDSAETEL